MQNISKIQQKKNDREDKDKFLVRNEIKLSLKTRTENLTYIETEKGKKQNRKTSQSKTGNQIKTEKKQRRGKRKE